MSALLDYYVLGWHTPYDSYRDFTFSKLVLYSDGLLIVSGTRFLQIQLSEEEVNQFIAQLDNLGYFALQTNQKHDTTDLLYDFGDQYSRIYDGLWYCVLVNLSSSREICAHDPQREFLVQEMVDILAFLDDFQPDGMVEYFPDRI